MLDIGCGTGVFALLLAERGFEVVGVDPAAGSLRMAKSKPGSHLVRWLQGDATNLADVAGFDLATMTGNAAQAIVSPEAWERTLRGVFGALRPGGTLVFETRDPAFRGWEEWNRAATHSITDLGQLGAVESWVDLTSVDGPLVTFRWTFVFASDGVVVTSDSKLRFRERDEVAASLLAQGYLVDEVRGAPARRPNPTLSARARGPR